VSQIMVTIKVTSNPLGIARTTTPTRYEHDQVLVEALDDPNFCTPQRNEEPDVQATLSHGRAWSQVKTKGGKLTWPSRADAQGMTGAQAIPSRNARPGDPAA
jgi:hypothetical protein